MRNAANISLGIGMATPFLSIAVVILLFGTVQSIIQIVIGASIMLSVAGVVLGIYSAFREKHSKVIPVLAIAINVMYLLGFAGYIVLRMSS